MSDDPLDSLHEAWRDLDCPRPHADEDPPTDALTRATVEWLRGAWSTLEAPPLALPTNRTAAGSNASRWTRRLLPLAGAVAAGWLLFLLWIAQTGERDTNDIVRAPERELPAMHATLRDDGSVELRSGVVRLVLMDPPRITNPDTIPTIPDPNPRVRNTRPRTTGEDR